MSPYYWAPSLAQAAYERGWLTLSAQKKALLMVEVGLHPEQAFVGTALLSAEQYALIVEQLWQIRLERLDFDRYVLRERMSENVSVVEAENEEGIRVDFHTDAWADEAAAPSDVMRIHTFRSDLLRWLRSANVVDLSMSEWVEAWSTVDATELRLGVEQGRGVVRAGVEQVYLDDGCIKAEEIPALQTWFEAGYGSRDWDATREAGLESDWLEVVAKHERHPLAKAQSWRVFLRQPKGILYISEPDAWLRRQLTVLEALEGHHRLFQAPKAYRFHPLTPGEREVAIHGALAGAAFCWVDETGESIGCVRELARAGIPVTVVRSRPTLYGTAWEVYSLSV